MISVFGGCPKRVGSEGLPQGVITIDLSIEWHRRLPVRRKHRLVTGGKVHDTETSVRQSAPIELTNTPIVRAAVRKRADHRLNGVRISLRAD